MDLLKEIEQRQSIKDFLTKPIEDEKMDRILEAGRLAPSAKNRQPWRFIVINDENLRENIQQAAFGQEHVGKAPALIAAASTNIDYRMPNGQLSYPIDIAFAVSFMMLQAEHEELCSCVITTFDEPEVKELLTIPYSMKVVMLLLLGYPASKPLKETRKPMERICAYNHW
jgi:nitroreductase